MKPKILIVISFFHPYRGGAEQQALLLGAELRRQGLSAAVLTRYFPGLPRAETVNGVTVYRAIYTMPWRQLFGISYFVSCLWFLIRKRHTYDSIHCYILQGFHSLAAIAMKYLFGKKVIIRISATGPLSDFLLLRQGLGGVFLLRCVRKADKIIVLCNQSRQEALAAGFRPQQIVHIPNGVDTTIFSPSPQPAADRNILFVGRLDHMKGVDILLKAISDLREGGIRTFCTIVGDGPIKKDLQNYARALAIDDQVVFPGTCSDIVPYLQQASVFVLPSHSEGVPNVILEAMAFALPIIATAVGGIPDIIQDGRNGLLIPPADSAALRLALARLLSDQDLAAKLGTQARRDAESCYSLNKIVDKYLELYQGHETTG
jgi:glycosyltransferase involved in cell wall biosynthesis